MSRYPVKKPPSGYFVVNLGSIDDSDTDMFAAGQTFYGDDDGNGPIIDLVLFRSNQYIGLDRRIKLFHSRDAAITACEVMANNHSRIVPT